MPSARKPKGGRPRSIRVSDEDWAALSTAAAEAGESISAYMLRRSLSPDALGPALLMATHTAADLQRQLVALTMAAARGEQDG